MPESLVYTVEEAGRLLRIGRGAAYEAVRRGDLPAVRIGRSLRVPRHALETMLCLANDETQPGRAASRTTSAVLGDGRGA
jgi:excisionase family DNA binding protein